VQYKATGLGFIGCTAQGGVSNHNLTKHPINLLLRVTNQMKCLARVKEEALFKSLLLGSNDLTALYTVKLFTWCRAASLFLAGALE